MPIGTGASWKPGARYDETGRFAGAAMADDKPGCEVGILRSACMAAESERIKGLRGSLALVNGCGRWTRFLGSSWLGKYPL